MKLFLEFSENLKTLLLDNKIEPKEFAKFINIDVSVIYRYLRKEVLPSMDKAIQIADYFDCSMDFLFGLVIDENSKNYKRCSSFVKRFRELLKAKGITRYRLNKSFNFSDQSLDDWYNGKRSPSIGHLISLSKVFNCTLDYLVGRE